MAEKQKVALWQFLNSNFGLWLCSAVFITGSGTALTMYQDNKATAEKPVEAIEKLDLKIAYRYFHVMNQLWHWFNKDTESIKLSPAHNVSEVQAVMGFLTERQPQHLVPLYAEYASFSLPTLHAELRRHLSGERQATVDEVLAQLAGGIAEGYT